MRVFPDDREPQHNRGADDKHSLSEDVVFLFFFSIFYPGEQRRREKALHHINKSATAQTGEIRFL